MTKSMLKVAHIIYFLIQLPVVLKVVLLLKKLWASYHLISEVLPDPRTKSWPLVAKPFHGLAILTLYILFVLKWGPKWMKNRPAYNVDKLLILHNLIQIVACSYIFYECLVYAWLWDYRWICEPVDYSDNPKSLKIARMVYYYYLSKYLDLFDTVFFILRKKFNQVTFLHVFHHNNMVIAIWGAITYFPGGHCTLVGLVNSFVHVVMYSYYLLTIFQPSTKQSVWWKKHITQLQIVQLLITCFHFGALLVTPNCEYPWWIGLLMLPSDFFLLGLFVDFYIRTYMKKGSKTNGVISNGDAAIKIVNVALNGHSEKVSQDTGPHANSELRQRY